MTPRVVTASCSILACMELASAWVRVFSMSLGGWVRRQAGWVREAGRAAHLYTIL